MPPLLLFGAGRTLFAGEGCATLFTRFAFWGFFVVVFALYWALPHRLRWCCLLAADLLFYTVSGSLRLAFALVVPVLVSWGGALMLQRLRQKNARRAVQRLALAVGCLLCLSFLLFYKYSGFLAGLLGLPAAAALQRLALPFGVSYYTLQTVSYLADVAAGRCRAETHLGYYAVSVTFFSLMLTGPIERPAALLPQLRAPRRFDERQAAAGVILAVWGLFEKLTVANILGSFVDAGFDHPAAVSGLSLLVCAVLYSLQIYCDFAGYSNLARGTALLLGLQVTQNFRQPYFSGSFRTFWSRWHISLSGWLRDYVYIPLGGSRCARPRQLFNLLVTFAVSGLWHGANLCFAAWGLLHGLYQCIGRLTARLRDGLWRRWESRTRLPRTAPVFALLRVVFIFALTTFAWVFFRVGSSTSAEAPAQLATVWSILRKIAADFTLQLQPWKEALVLLRFDVGYLLRMAFLLAVVAFADWKSRPAGLEDWVLGLAPWARLALGWGIALCILFFGVDTGAPIYFQF